MISRFLESDFSKDTKYKGDIFLKLLRNKVLTKKEALIIVENLVKYIKLPGYITDTLFDDDYDFDTTVKEYLLSNTDVIAGIVDTRKTSEKNEGNGIFKRTLHFS